MPLERSAIRWLAGMAAVVLPAIAFGQETKVRTWVDSLSSENFRERIESRDRLLEWGRKDPARAMDLLYTEHAAAGDAEARILLREALRALVVENHQKNHGEGYVGVRMLELNVAVPGDEVPRTGVQVIGVEPESPADHAGLVAGDVIVSLDGLRWSGPGATDAFTAAVRKHKPQETVKLGLLRNGEVNEVSVTLGIRPLGALEKQDFLWANGLPRSIPNPQEAEEKAKETIFRIWLERKRAAKKVP
jgi:hypothetical protein